jgi:TrwC relaxase
VQGGVKFYRGAAWAARAYVERDRSRADDYYPGEGTGVAERLTASLDGVAGAGSMDGDAYEQWVAGMDLDTGRTRGRVREDTNALRFVEVIVNGPKASHPHLHLPINERVWAAGARRGLHSVGVRDMIEAINGIGHAAVATDPEFRAVLAAHAPPWTPRPRRSKSSRHTSGRSALGPARCSATSTATKPSGGASIPTRSQEACQFLRIPEDTLRYWRTDLVLWLTEQTNRS